MYGNDKTVNPADFPSDKDADDLTDRGDEGLDEEEEHVEEADERKQKKAPAKKEEESEEEEEESEEEEEESEEEEEESEETDKKPAMVALHVLKKAQSKRRTAEARVEELERQLKVQTDQRTDRQKEQFDKLSNRMEELYEQVEEARAEGKAPLAAKLQRELDGIKDKMTSSQATLMATRQALQSQNLQAYNALVSELEVLDPRFDSDDDEYDEDLTERVDEVTQAYEAKGMSAPDALRKALRLIMGEDPFREARRLARAAVKKSAADASTRKVEVRKTDVKKNLEAKRKQPPEDRETTKERPGKINAMKLSDEDFDKLPESKLRELRGDFG